MPETFNPDVQNIQPGNYIGWSRPISGFQGDKSKGTLLKGIGSDIDEGANVLNTAVKTDLRDQVDRGITAIRDQNKDRLQTVYQQSMDNPDSLLPNVAGAPPQHVQDNINHTTETYDAARKSGKYSDTYLDMQYDDFLKGMRSKYPGYRDYIDETVARSLDRGLPANREIRQLTSDINANIQTAKEQRTKSQDLQINKLALDGDPEAQAAVHYLHLLPEQEKTDLIHRKLGDIADIARIKNVRDTATEPGARAAAGTQEANLRLNTSYSNFFHTFTMGASNVTPEQLVSQINSMSDTDEDKAKARLTLQTYIQAYKAKQQKDFSQVDPKTGRSLDGDIGGRSGDLVEQHLEGLRKFTKWVENGQGGAAAVTIEHAKALSNPATGGQIPIDNQTHANTVDTVARDNPNGNGFLTSLATSRIGSPGIKANANARHIAVAAGRDYQGNEGVPPIAQIMEQDKGQFTSDKVGSANARDYFNNLVSWYRDALMQKDNPAVQRNMAYSLYGPGNDDVLKHFKPDTGTDKGQASVYNQWFSRAVDKEMFTNLGKSDANLLSSYEGLKKDSFGRFVLPGELHNMDVSTVGMGGAGDFKGIKWSYDNLTHKVIPYYNGDTPPHGFKNLEAAAARVNIGLDSLSSMAKYTGEDVNSMMLQWLTESGLGNGPATKGIRDAVRQSFSADQQKKQDQATKLLKQLKDTFKKDNESSGSGDSDDD